MKISVLIAPLLLSIVICTSTFAQETNTTVRFKPEKLDFRGVLEMTCKPKKLVVTNTSGSNIENPDFAVEGAREFSVQNGFRKCPNPLLPGDTCRVYVDFCPQLYRTYKATLKFSGSQTGIPMIGRGATGRGDR